jgi:hypothetical protein
VEKSDTNNYQRLILSQGRLIGAQAIGDTQDMGALLYALIRKDELKELKQLASGKPPLLLIYRDYGVVRYGASRPAVTKGRASPHK